MIGQPVQVEAQDQGILSGLSAIDEAEVKAGAGQEQQGIHGTLAASDQEDVPTTQVHQTNDGSGTVSCRITHNFTPPKEM